MALKRLAKEFEEAATEQKDALAAFRPVAERIVSARAVSEALILLSELLEADVGTNATATEFRKQAARLEKKGKRPAHRPAGLTTRQRYISTAIMATGGPDLPLPMAAKVNAAIVDYLFQIKPWPLADRPSVVRSVQVERKRLRQQPGLLWEALQQLASIMLGPEEKRGRVSPGTLEGEKLLCRALLPSLGDDDEKKSAALLLARADEITR